MYSRVACISEIEVCVGPRWDEAGDPVGKQGPERRSRLQQRVPALHRLVVFPEYLAEIIERREMCRRGQIGEARCFAGKPRTGLGEMAEIGEMIAHVLVSCPDRRDFWGAAVMTLVHLLVHEIGCHLVVELAVKPVD